MATTLSYGYVKPQTGDKGSVFFPALEDNITRLNDHTHNGTNSARLTATSADAVSQSISAASWASQGGGMYRQTVTMPSFIFFDTHAIQFRNSSTGEIMYLQAVKVTSNTYYVYINDNSIDLKAVYTS